MALPEDVTTFELTFGPYTDAAGEPVFAGMTGKIKPSFPQIRHVASGAVVIDSPIPVVIDGFGVASVELAHTDQAVLSPVGFTYSVVWDVASRKPSPGNKQFAVPTSAGAEVDFDLLAPSPDVEGVVVPLTYGKSAYDLAVENGFVGTEAAWLASLVGPMGTSNPTGGAGGALSGTYPNPGLNATSVDTVVAGRVADTASATAVALTAAFGPRRFPGVTLTTYGHSYTVNDGTHVTAGSEFFNLLRDRHGFVAAPTYGDSGAYAIEAASTMANGYDKTNAAVWTPGKKGVVVFDAMANDTTDMPLDAPKVLQRFRNGLNYALTTLGAGTRTLATSAAVTKSGTWSTLSIPADKLHPGLVYNTTANPDYLECSITGPEVTVVLFSFDPADAAKPTLSISVDGTVVKSLDMATVPIRTYGKHATGGGTSTFAQYPVRLTGLGGGAHTIRVTRTGGTGNLFVESFVTPSTTPPHTLVLLDPMPTPAASQYAAHLAHRAAMHAAAREIIADYPFARAVSLADMDGVAATFKADGLHPNDAGAAWIADILTPQLNAITRPLTLLA